MKELTKREIEKQNKLNKEKPLALEKFKKYPDKRAVGESTAIVQVQKSYLCNLSCEHCCISCLRKPEGTKSLNPDDVGSIAKQMHELGLASFQFSGGNPTCDSELEESIKKIDPSLFYVQVDSNGILDTEDSVKKLKDMGVDRMEISVDSMNEQEHDEFRRRNGSWRKAVDSIGYIHKANLDIQIATVVTRERLYSDEFISFLEFMKELAAPVSAIWPKPVGNWERRVEIITEDDMVFFESLRKEYDVYCHTTSGFGGLNGGCCSGKRILNITQYGDCFPCCTMYFNLGNIYDKSLKEILEKGMKYFGSYKGKCLLSENKEFIEKYVSKTWGKEQPIPIEEIISLSWEKDLNRK